MPAAVASPAVASAPGKVILVGEHAVVHGAPAIALPLDGLRATVRVSPIAGPLTLCALGQTVCLDRAEAMPVPLQGLAGTVREALARLGAPPSGLSISIESDLPIGRGLGSGAAAAVALVRALYASFGRALALGELLELADIAERHAHGRPSGIDAAVAASARPLRFVRGELPRPIAPGRALHFVVADTRRARRTADAVAKVAAAIEADGRGAIDALADLAGTAEAAVVAGDAAALGTAMNAAHAVLGGLGVSDEALDTLAGRARDAGALGAKLTGAGLGGCLLALVADADAQQALLAALAADGTPVWPLVLAPETT